MATVMGPRLAGTFAIVVLLSLCAGAGRAAAQSASPATESAVAPFRLEGEFGLWVEVTGDSVAVGWLTDEAAPGFLHVLSDGKVLLETSTPRDSAHRAVFPRPRARRIEIRYGTDGASDERHETLLDLGAPPRPRTSWPAPDSIFVISDVHGELERMTTVLKNGDLIDENLRWTGGRKQLVVLGDVFDRGPDALAAVWYLYDLERQAEAAGGRVHYVLGNHEIMVMAGDLRYLSSKDTVLARLHGVGFPELVHPSRSVLGRWLVSKTALLKVGDLLFVHGGVTTDYLDWKLDQVEDSLTAWTAEDLFTRWNDTTYAVPLDSASYERRLAFFWLPRSPFWYRGYVRSDSLGASLDSVLKHFDVSAMVVGHTPGETVRERYGGRVIAVNTLPFGAEMLLLVRKRGGWERWRVAESGSPKPLPPEEPPGSR